MRCAGAFLNPDLYAELGPAAIALGMTHQQMSEVDEILTPALNQGLLGQPLDLAAINIARGRDLGLPTFNDFREGIGLRAYESWADFGQNMVHPQSLAAFIAAYSFDGDTAKANAIVGLENGSILEGDAEAMGFTVEQAITFLNGGDQGVDKIDSWLGGIAEAHVGGGLLGETFNTVFVEQIERLMDGDRFYYLYRLFGTQMGEEVNNGQFKDIVERNTGLTHLNGSVFSYADEYYDFTALPESSDPNAYKSEHKYGAQLAAHPGVGIWSDGGLNESGNGALITINGVQYIRDVRAANPDALNGGEHLDGAPNSGAESAEVIVGTEFDDVIHGRGGDDTLYGEGGNDILYGDGGIDRIYGGDGNDIIWGGDGPRTGRWRRGRRHHLRGIVGHVAGRHRSADRRQRQRHHLRRCRHRQAVRRRRGRPGLRRSGYRSVHSWRRWQRLYRRRYRGRSALRRQWRRCDRRRRGSGPAVRRRR